MKKKLWNEISAIGASARKRFVIDIGTGLRWLDRIEGALGSSTTTTALL